MPNWGWAEGTNRYRNLDTGRFVSAAQVREWGAEAIEAGGLATNGFAEMVVDGRLNVRDWTLLMRDEIKDLYVQQYIVAIGGVRRLTRADAGSLGGMLKEQYTYLSRFAREIADGKLTAGQIAARSRMYLRSSREAFERAQTRVYTDAQEIRWVVNEAIENCPDCLEFEAMGWQKRVDNPYRGAIPGSGNLTRCGVNCGCHIEYR